ncbi:MAG TPA: hypothetical protein VFA70_00130 [Dehalococcoidia bacterium]|nr:hypothetical protein [Dehalococcoidia bacterium]
MGRPPGASATLDRVRSHLLEGWPPGLLRFAIIGLWLALACAYMMGAGTAGEDLNDGAAGRAAFTVVLLVALLGAFIGGMRASRHSGPYDFAEVLSIPALIGVCGGAPALVFAVAFTAALLGAWLGGLLRRGTR